MDKRSGKEGKYGYLQTAQILIFSVFVHTSHHLSSGNWKIEKETKKKRNNKKEKRKKTTLPFNFLNTGFERKTKVRKPNKNKKVIKQESKIFVFFLEFLIFISFSL